MASVKSTFRTLVKPFLFRLLGESGYAYAQYLGKVKDIKGRLVEEEEMELFPTFVSEGDEVLDVGANYAYHTHRLANLCGNGKVYAFEPIPFTHQVCEKVIRHFRLNNVRLFQKGVGSENGEATFRVPVVGFGGISGGQSHLAGRNNELVGKEKHYDFARSREVTCEIITVDSFLPQLQRLSFIKLDIEGAEYFALQGMKSTIARCKPVIMLEINPFFLDGFGIPEADLRGYFVELGYTLYTYLPDCKKLQKYPDDRSFEEKNYLALSSEHQARHASLLLN